MAKAKKKVPGCLNCEHARWVLTANGRISQSRSGRCVVPIPLPVLPACIPGGFNPHREPVLPGDGLNCQFWVLRQGSPQPRTVESDLL